MNEFKMGGDKRITRRTFLKWAAVFGGAAAVAAGARWRSQDPGSGGVDLPTPVPAPTKDIEPPEILMYEKDGMRVWAKGGIPNRWENANGAAGNFDMEALIKAKQAAIDSKEIRFGTVAKIGPSYKENKIDPVAEIKQTPEGMLTKEQLAIHGIEIIEAEDVGLSFTPGAFEPGEIFENYQESKTNKLAIMIVDKPTLLLKAFNDTRYDKYRETINMIFTADAEKRSGRDYLDYLIRVRSTEVPSQETPFQRVQREGHLAMLKSITDAEIDNYWLYSGTTDGYYEQAGFQGRHLDTAVMMIAIADRPDNLDFITVSANFDGSFQFWDGSLDLQDEFVLQHKNALRQDQSYPEAEKFPETGNTGGLSPGVEPNSKTPGFVIRHEGYHGWRYINMIGAEPAVIDNEALDDKQTRDSFERATRKKRSGDLSGYYTVLNNKTDGYFVVT